MAQAEVILNFGGLSSLSGARGSNQDNIGNGFLGTNLSSLDFSEELFKLEFS
jgi:hypothetical protein